MFFPHWILIKRNIEIIIDSCALYWQSLKNILESIGKGWFFPLCFYLPDYHLFGIQHPLKESPYAKTLNAIGKTTKSLLISSSDSGKLWKWTKRKEIEFRSKSILIFLKKKKFFKYPKLTLGKFCYKMEEHVNELIIIFC